MGLKKPIFIIAVVLLALSVLVEVGSTAVLKKPAPAAAGALDSPTPGFGIPYLALLDGMLLFTLVLMLLSLVVPERIHGRVQGVATLIVAFLLLMGSILLIIVTLMILLLMVGLLLAPIFGTIAYFAIFGDFDKSGAAATLGLLMVLKLGFVICLLVSDPRFLQNKGLVLLILTSLLAQVILAFLHGLVPMPLVSITDAVGGIVNAILAAIWGIIFFIGSLISVIKTLRVDRAMA